MAHKRETISARTLLKNLPTAARQAKELFFTSHKVAPLAVESGSEEPSAFAVPKGIDTSTADGQKALTNYRRAMVRRSGYRAVPHIHIEPGTLPHLLGEVTIEPIQAVEDTSKPKFLMGFTRRRVRAVDSMDRNIRSGKKLIEETVELDHLFNHLNHNVSLEEHRKNIAEKNARKLAAIQGAPSVQWEEGTPVSSDTPVVWEE